MTILPIAKYSFSIVRNPKYLPILPNNKIRSFFIRNIQNTLFLPNKLPPIKFLHFELIPKLQKHIKITDNLPGIKEHNFLQLRR